mgnify:CR=1 FL=1
MSKARGESGLMEGCRLCGSVTSGHDNKRFYEIIDLAVQISCNRSQKINYLMELARMTTESADGCAEDYEHISDAIKATEKIFKRIKELIKDHES